MNNRDEAEILDGPEPPVPQLALLEPLEPVPADLDDRVRADIRGRLRQEKRAAGGRRRTARVATISALAAAAAAVGLTLWLQPMFGDQSAMLAKGDGRDVDLFLAFLVQHEGEPSPRRLERGEAVQAGDGLYLRAEISEPGEVTFLVDEPGGAWESLATISGTPGPNDLQHDGQIKIFYVTEAGPYRFAAVWSVEPPPEDWNPGAGNLPDATRLGEDAELSWIDVEAIPR